MSRKRERENNRWIRTWVRWPPLLLADLNPCYSLFCICNFLLSFRHTTFFPFFHLSFFQFSLNQTLKHLRYFFVHYKLSLLFLSFQPLFFQTHKTRMRSSRTSRKVERENGRKKMERRKDKERNIWGKINMKRLRKEGIVFSSWIYMNIQFHNREKKVTSILFLLPSIFLFFLSFFSFSPSLFFLLFISSEKSSSFFASLRGIFLLWLTFTM